MSYTTRYGKCRYDTAPKQKRRYGIPMLIAVISILILLHYVFPSQLAQIRKSVLPFLEPEVQQSFSEMAASIRSGTDLEEAAAVFCREILIEAAH